MRPTIWPPATRGPLSIIKGGGTTKKVSGQRAWAKQAEWPLQKGGGKFRQTAKRVQGGGATTPLVYLDHERQIQVNSNRRRGGGATAPGGYHEASVRAEGGGSPEAEAGPGDSEDETTSFNRNTTN